MTIRSEPDNTNASAVNAIQVLSSPDGPVAGRVPPAPPAVPPPVPPAAIDVVGDAGTVVGAVGKVVSQSSGRANVPESTTVVPTS